MNLVDVAHGVAVAVARVGGDRPFRRRLMELGLVPGTLVSVEKVAPLGDPLELSVRGCRLSIRRAEAAAVAVDEPVALQALEGVHGVPADVAPSALAAE